MSEDLSKKRLGRGLSTLIGDINPAPVALEIKDQDLSKISKKTSDKISLNTNNNLYQDTETDLSIKGVFLNINDITPNPNNPRQSFAEEELDDLVNSIREHGIIQPIIVRILLDKKSVEIVAGERRWRAAQKAGLTKIPVIIKNIDDRTSLEIAIIENVQRADLNPIEEAKGYQKLITEYSYSQNAVAQVIGKSRSYVTNSLRLLKLPAEILQYIQNNLLSVGHARALVSAKNPLELANKVIKQQLSVRQLEYLIQQQDANDIKKEIENGLPLSNTDKENHIYFLEEVNNLKQIIKDKIGLNLSVKTNKYGGGNLMISYKNIEDIKRISQQLTINEFDK
ncbi:ParB/RepB/Spo0J family partition protein [Bartonella sp. DGB1]|uniref:ParB/RepB/Spo0J family partition protein n=1 Tax=Bartonella sp. DGB1 TaxID=3239807 RepID=UPI003525905C